MKLSELIGGLDVKKIKCFEDCEICGVVFDSRNVKKGDLFVALKGENFNGQDFVMQAIKSGAKAVVVEKEIAEIEIPQIVVFDTRSALSIIFSNLYGNPKDKLKFVGITGTNGKTTTSFIIAKILECAGKKVGIIGSNGIYINNVFHPNNFTTPDPDLLHKSLAQMVLENVEFVVMEVSAHGIALKKHAGIKFDIGILTNITIDHLDFFKTMSAYAKTKLDFMRSSQVRVAVVNSDEPYLNNFETANPIISYGLENPADSFAINIISKKHGTKFVVNILDNVLEINTHLSGKFNVYNALAGMTACLLLGIKPKYLKQGMALVQAPEGRFNVYKLKNGKTAIIDFAHTPDGLEKILTACRDICKGKLICVFGSGGSNDLEKRILMGQTAEKFADYCFVTTDNPKFEDQNSVLKQIESGMKKKNHICEIDRKTAILKAVEMANKEDLVVICGKGAEKYQDIMGVKIPYSDLEVLKEMGI